MTRAKRPGRLASATAAALGLAAVMTGCTSLFNRAEQYPEMVDKLTALAKTDVPAIAKTLDAEIENTTGTTEYVGAEGGNLFKFLVRSKLIGPKPNESQLETVVVAAGYTLVPHDDSYHLNYPIAFGKSESKGASISVSLGDPVGDGSNYTVNVSFTASPELSLSDSQTKRLRELYNTDPVNIEIKK